MSFLTWQSLKVRNVKQFFFNNIKLYAYLKRNEMSYKYFSFLKGLGITYNLKKVEWCCGKECQKYYGIF